MSMSLEARLRQVGDWTYDDLLALPESPYRYEIVDGSLVVSPAPAVRHELVVEQVRVLLRAAMPRGWGVVGAVGIHLGRSYRLPDVALLSTAVLRDAATVEPADVLLAVEVVSPGSVTTDRVTKPAQYAAAGLRYFWRIEPTDEPLLTAYALRGAPPYVEVGRWSAGDVVEIDEPVRIRFPAATLLD